MHLAGIGTLLILLSLDQDITIHPCRYLETGVPPVIRKRRCAKSLVGAVNGPPSRNINRLGGRGALDVRSRPGPAAWKALDPVPSERTSGTDPGPFQMWFGQFTTGSQILGAGNTRTLPWKGSGADPCLGVAPRGGPPPPRQGGNPLLPHGKWPMT
jgi:hypothetical protein